MRSIITLLLVIFMLSNCSRERLSPCFNYNWAPPKTLLFVIKHKNKILADSTLNALKLFYKTNNQTIYVSDFGRVSAEWYPLGIMASRDIAWKSADSLIKNYYLEYPNGMIDTLYVDYKAYNACEADTSFCQCWYPRKKVMFNNIAASYDDSVTQVIQEVVYRFNK